MRKHPKSNLDAFTEQLDQWFGEEEITAHEARRRLEALGCNRTVWQLYRWWQRRQAYRLQELVLDQIRHGATQCSTMEKEFGSHPPPAIETLLKLHRVLLLKYSTEANADPKLMKLLGILMKPVLDWARAVEERKLRELARKTAERGKDGKAKALRPETLEKVEEEINLL